ncbi:uncharacterized protein SPPG_06271 [Spizellomyces punctatus DAOM BR117]|uniref:F-box domain-containing protein n=1 Tax=Spizellomyces punctatus (strain DAOM BR117) TaxID=645134 RepID=A0A0L0HCE1_SPIPD|nr:uncharacterized protein SPPG_06271 [Spizellomyces punctatus DAOM BR117]KNC98586.1 hypothetical protein SPPG_06271 [Spizellomyces punctatus DAOM BR117]|eukprot:XP_016606626.1 hypothetical protein SPPG_06271 [Spizellomyces punctatus DAOM BR117]
MCLACHAHEACPAQGLFGFTLPMLHFQDLRDAFVLVFLGWLSYLLFCRLIFPTSSVTPPREVPATAITAKPRRVLSAAFLPRRTPIASSCGPVSGKKNRENEPTKVGEEHASAVLEGIRCGRTRGPRLLPPELLEMVLLFVDYQDLSSCQLVSRYWHSVASWLLYGTLLQVPIGSLEFILSISSITYGHLVAECDFRHLPITDKHIQMLCENCPNVQWLDVSGTSVTDSAVEMIVDRLQRLEYLFVNFCEEVTAEIMPVLRRRMRWRGLGLMGIKFRDLDDHLDGLIMENSGLEGLYLSGTSDRSQGITSRSIRTIAHHTPRLQAFGMGLCDDAGPEEFVEVVKNCPPFQELLLEDCIGLNDSVVSILAERHWESLRTVSLSGCRNATTRGLSFLFQKCQLLREIYMDTTQLDHEAVKVLVEHCPHVRCLRMGQCPEIENDSIVLALQRLPKLEDLVVGYSDRITDTWIEELAAGTKGCGTQELTPESIRCDTTISERSESVQVLSSYDDAAVTTDTTLSLVNDRSHLSLKPSARKFPNLEVLCLNRTVLHSSSITLIVSLFPNLWKLYLEGCDIGDDGIRALAATEEVVHEDHIRTESSAGSMIDKRSLSSVVPKLSVLEVLNLCEVTIAQKQTVQVLLSTLKTLRVVEIVGCGLPMDDVVSLRQEFSGVDLVFDDDESLVVLELDDTGDAVGAESEADSEDDADAPENGDGEM